MTKDQPTRDRVHIVGGSAAGFFTAYLLARRGVPVQVFEQAEPMDPAARTLIVTHRMRDLLGPLGESAVVNQIRRFELFTDGISATISLRQPDLVIERAKLIRGLAEQAQAQGAQVLLGRKFVGLERNGQALTLTFERAADNSTAKVPAKGGGIREWIPAGTVVGADGAVSRVAQAAGWPKQPTVPLVQAVVRLPADMPADTVRVWFVPKDTPYFYWLIPESPTHGALGLIGEDGQETRQRLDGFLKKRGLAAESFQGARIPLYARRVPVHRRVGGSRVFLVGDAAGQVKVTTVGGIVTGFRGALGVAEAILNGGSSRELRALERELNLHLLLRRALHQFTQADYSRLLDLLNVSARDSLAVFDRDAAFQIVWRLCLCEPRLLLMGIRGLLAGGALRRNARARASLPGPR